MRSSLIPAVSAPQEGSYHGHPTITLPDPVRPSDPGICLGVKKVMAVLNNLEACEAFVAKHSKNKEIEKIRTTIKQKFNLSDEEVEQVLAGAS